MAADGHLGMTPLCQLGFLVLRTIGAGLNGIRALKKSTIKLKLKRFVKRHRIPTVYTDIEVLNLKQTRSEVSMTFKGKFHHNLVSLHQSQVHLHCDSGNVRYSFDIHMFCCVYVTV